MLRIGITGAMGSGKSWVAKIFHSLGIPTYNADERGKFLLNNSKVISNQLTIAFGEGVYDANGNLLKSTLAEIVFNQPIALKKLNDIVHPAIFEDFDNYVVQQELKNPPPSYILKEAALMFETDSWKQLDKIICVTCPFEIRLERIQRRDPLLTEKQILSRMNNQFTEDQKREKADFEIHNDGQTMVLNNVLDLHHKFCSLKVN